MCNPSVKVVTQAKVIKLDINALRVFNSMHKLDITETEFEDILREQNEVGNTGLYIGSVKKGYSICVSHDQNHRIIVKRLRGKTNDEVPVFPSRVLFKTLTTLVDLPQEIYTLHAIAEYRALADITHKEIGLIIADGRKEYNKLQRKIRAEDKAKVDKSKEFLAHAIKLTKAVKINGGYKVRGQSGCFYTIDRENLGVNMIVKGKKEYLCIVDMGGDSSSDWGKNDKIAKRLLMLHKDIKVASEIYTLGDKMDKHWSEITNNCGVEA